jgi:hypothetical protein
MFETGSWLWQWLANQPPFVEVAIGMGFVMLLAPTVLAAVAIACTSLEMLAASIAANRLTIRPFASGGKGAGDRDRIAPRT